jgi:hypothetical protein
MRTYTLFLPGVTEADCPADESEFEIFSFAETEEINIYSLIKNNASEGESGLSDIEGSTDESLGEFSGDEYDFSEAEDNDVFTIPEAPTVNMQSYDDIFSTYGLENVSDEQFDEIPDYYVNKDSWIKSTNLLCVSCSNKIQGMPMFIPISWHKRLVTKQVDRYDNEDEYAAAELDELNNIVNTESAKHVVEERAMKVYRLTCNERCAVYYINHVRDDNITNQRESLQMLKELVQDIRDVTVNSIKEGLDKNIMMQYKGPSGVSAQTFREMNSIDGHYT